MRDGRLPHPLVMLVTDRRRNPAGCLTCVRNAARVGVNLIQLRERGLEDAELLALAEAVGFETAGTGAATIVNDRLDVAVAAGADGVHLPAAAVSGSRVRAIAPAGFLIGRSVHGLEEALEVEAEGGCDYLIFGSVFESASKPAGHRVAGLDALAEVCAAVSLPVVAIGGITAARLPAVARAGAAGVAAIGMFSTEDLQEMLDRVREIRLAFCGT